MELGGFAICNGELLTDVISALARSEHEQSILSWREEKVFMRQMEVCAVG